MQRNFRAPLWRQILPDVKEFLLSLLLFAAVFVVLPVLFG